MRLSTQVLARAVALALAATVSVVGPRSARAWVDANVLSDDVVISLSVSGQAHVEHRIGLRIAGGPLRGFDIKGVDEDASPEADSYVVPMREALRSSLASAQPITLERVPESNHQDADGHPRRPWLHLRFGTERGLSRGVYQIVARYVARIDKEVVPRGALARIAWTGPVWDDGVDSARVTFELPRIAHTPAARAGGVGDNRARRAACSHGTLADSAGRKPRPD